MKIFAGIIITLWVLTGASFGVWGYITAQDVRQQGRDLQRITSDTTRLSRSQFDQSTIKLKYWKLLSDQATSVKSEIQSIHAASETLKANLNSFYSNEASNRYAEIQYLKVLTESQRKLDLDNSQSKTKEQIDALLNDLNQFELNLSSVSINNAGLAGHLADLGYQITTLKRSLEYQSGEASILDSEYEVNTADLSKSINNLRQEIIKALDSWVSLQDQIKNEMDGMPEAVWVNPLN